MAIGQLDIEIIGDATNILAALKKTEAAAGQVGAAFTKVSRDSSGNFAKAEEGIKRMGVAATASQRAIQGASSNITAQFQDIAVQAQMGANSMAIAIQQGTQLGEAIKNVAAQGGGLKALGGAVLSMLNPISLLTIGFVYLAAEAAKYFFEFTKSESAEEQLKKHNELIKNIQILWPQATEKLKEYATQTKAMVQLLAEEELKAAQKRQQEAQQTALGGVSGESNLAQILRETMAQVPQATADWQMFSQALAQGELNTSALDATTQQLLATQGRAQTVQQGSAMRIRDIAHAIGEATTSGFPELDRLTRQWVSSLLAGVPKSKEFSDSLFALKTEIGNTNPELSKLIDEWIREAEAAAQAEVATAGAGNAAEVAGGQAAGAAGGVRTLATAYRELSAAMGSLYSASLPDLTKRQKIWNDYNTAVSKGAETGSLTAIADAKMLRDTALAQLPEIGPTMADMNRLKGEQVAKLTEEANAYRDLADPTRQYQREVEKINGLVAKNIMTQTEANATIGKLREQYFPAKGGGGGGGGGGGKEMIPGLDMSTEQLEAWSKQMQMTLDPTIRLREEQDKLNAAIAAGKFPAELQAQAMAKLQEQYGQTAEKTFDLQKTFESMMTSWGQNVASSLADAIVEGEDLGQVFQDLIKQLIKMALEMLVLKPLMDSLMSGFGSMGGAGGFLGGLFPAATAAAPMAANQNLPRPGMLGARNATTSAGHTSNSTIGGVTVNIGTSGKGVEADGKKANAMGERLRDVIQREIVAQSRPGGLLWGGGRR
jgi:hypothetical protein